ncbi:hypothetical protein [Candidatus Nitrosacidococcus sp. I8]|uniref:hypothetical protein n=1 Tax=Candidatus Nitrosacidococcus sp. I8 TaxID=2942908 RepID=UPI002227FC94|nr:hypothetical protein [Candidatus Nitrosacidococcus sp. I8]CAH9014878.1 hypothetical protein NURINAE_00116 [Candidatus Nitrosacidococcus sp. I8]
MNGSNRFSVARFKQETKDFLERILVPSIAILLPWGWAFRIFQWITTHCPWFYGAQGNGALAEAQRVIHIEDPVQWLWTYRLIQLVDQGDLYLSRCRSHRWIDQYMQVTGTWPKPPFLGITFHWGAGLWSLRHLHTQGISAAFLSARFNRASFPKRWIAYGYTRLRIKEIKRASGSSVIYKGGSITQMKAAIHEGKAITALIDVPPREVGACLPISLFDRQAWWPSGLVKFAIREQIPVVAFSVGINLTTGIRQLHISDPLSGDNPQAFMEYLAGYFSDLITQMPPAWHCWDWVEEFFHHKSR